MAPTLPLSPGEPAALRRSDMWRATETDVLYALNWLAVAAVVAGGIFFFF